MLAAITNPGQYIRPDIDIVPGVALMVLSGVIFIAIQIVGERVRSPFPYMWHTLSAIAAAGALFALVGTAVHISDVEQSSRDAYQADVQEWLHTDYSIDVTKGEASTLFDNDSIAVELGGELAPIQIINGPDETVQVQIVGGSIIVPAE
jgi:hypothetical protein